MVDQGIVDLWKVTLVDFMYTGMRETKSLEFFILIWQTKTPLRV